MTEREQVISKIVTLILAEMEESDKGNLTTRYAIGILNEAIARLEERALMSPLKNYVED